MRSQLNRFLRPVRLASASIIAFSLFSVLPAQEEIPQTDYNLPMPISQEPLIFRIRRGTAFTDDAERWKVAHTEENVKKIAETGQRMLYTHFYKGYGFLAEKEEMDMAVQVAAWARKYGMISDNPVYLNEARKPHSKGEPKP